MEIIERHYFMTNKFYSDFCALSCKTIYMKVNNHVHEYLRSISAFRYTLCENCKSRTQFGCTRCGYCWSCHFQKEQSERDWLEKLFNIRDVSSISYQLRSETLRDTDRLGYRNRNEEVRVVDVFGEDSEPICNYLRCHHKFSIHGEESHICRCKHPQNRVIGVSQSG
jgi:hypothetical protein